MSICQKLWQSKPVVLNVKTTVYKHFGSSPKAISSFLVSVMPFMVLNVQIWSFCNDYLREWGWFFINSIIIVHETTVFNITRQFWWPTKRLLRPTRGPRPTSWETLQTIDIYTKKDRPNKLRLQLKYVSCRNYTQCAKDCGPHNRACKYGRVCLHGSQFLAHAVELSF